MNKEILDGCTAAAHVAYALSEVATIYPITPVASMGQTAQKWGMEGRRNFMGQRLEVKEMESELGAAGAAHGAAAAGALVTTFTASQGLMLMIPNLFKVAGEQLPIVFHVGCRTVATHALSIFGDHQDVMTCRTTGVAILASSSVQEAMDLALVAHLSAIEGRMPVVHFFDGWRTSSEMNTIDVIDYSTIESLVDHDAVDAFRQRALNPEHPRLRGSAQNPDVYFQNSEARNSSYADFPKVVQQVMDKVGVAIGRHYSLVEYYGAPDADRVIVVMASGADVVMETVDYINSSDGGYKVGVVKVRLYRPFPTDAFLKALPSTVKTIAVLDRTTEPGAPHEPLCLDVIDAVHRQRPQIKVIGGRFGLSSKEFNPSMAKAVFDFAANPSRSVFTVGINDDVTHLSLPLENPPVDTAGAAGLHQAVFYGIGNDGTVSATRQMATVAVQAGGLFAQAYFNYSAKKSGGYTISQLRIGNRPITSAYSIEEADYVGCHKASYVRRFAMADRVRKEGTFVINCPWTSGEKLVEELPLDMRRVISAKGLKLYTIDADAIAASEGLGARINMIMLTAYMHLSGTVDFSEGLDSLRQQIRVTYRHDDEDVVNRNLRAVDRAVNAIHAVDYSSIPGWTSTAEKPQQVYRPAYANAEQKRFIEQIHTPCIHGRGDEVAVSAFTPDGTVPMSTTAYEHRRIATKIPVWDAAKCVECGECSLVCPHAAIRPYVLDDVEVTKAPSGLVTKEAHGAESLKGYRWRIQNFPADCLGCGSCSLICPGHALTMTPIEEVIDCEMPLCSWVRENVRPKPDLLPAATVNGSQLQQPMLEFSGACAGCGETPYVKLLTQLFGRRLIIANATGCSSIWGADFPSNPYCTDAEGRGPAWGNSLFEDNAEYGFGILTAQQHRRSLLSAKVRGLIEAPDVMPYLKEPLEAWYAAKDSPEMSALTASQLVDMLTPVKDVDPRYGDLLKMADMMAKKSVWIVGGDGWAYDIGFAGLDHVLASGEPVKILVLDTECYSNTGGQTSKATPRSCMAKYSPEGKDTPKKDLGRMMMTYGDVYVASISLGANYQQAINALIEAENYPGAAIVIAYCPCLDHGIRPGLGHSIVEERRAVEAGYWPLYRFNPSAVSRQRLTVDSVIPGPDNSAHNGSTPETTSATFTTKEPLTLVGEYINQENRYADLRMTSPDRAAVLQSELQADCSLVNDLLKRQSGDN